MPTPVKAKINILQRANLWKHFLPRKLKHLSIVVKYRSANGCNSDYSYEARVSSFLKATIVDSLKSYLVEVTIDSVDVTVIFRYL